MVFSLALAVALLCGLAALFGSSGDLGPLILTALLTTMLGGVMYAGLRQFDRPHGDVPALVTVGMGLLVWFFLVVGIWWNAIDVGTRDVSDRLTSSGLIILACWLPIYIGAFAWRNDVSRRFALVLLILWILGMVAMVLVSWMADPAWWMAWIITPTLISGTLAALLQLHSTLWRWAAWLGTTAAVAGGLLWMTLDAQMINFPFDPHHVHVTLMFSCMTLGACLAVPNALLLIAPGRAPLLRIATIGCTVFSLMALGTAIEGEMVGRAPAFKEAMARVAAGLGMLAITGGLALFMLRRLGTSFLEQRHGKSLAVRCPRCRGHIEVGQGPTSCPLCGLKFRIAFEPPNCRTCDYDLSPNYPQRCPECGTAVALPELTSVEGEAAPCCDEVATASDNTT
jgi:hypothetical protein